MSVALNSKLLEGQYHLLIVLVLPTHRPLKHDERVNKYVLMSGEANG